MTLSPSANFCREIWGRGLVLSCLVAASVAAAQERPARDGRAAAAQVQSFVDDTTLVILKINTSQIGAPDLESTRDSFPRAARAAYVEIAGRLGAGSKQLRELLDDQPVFAVVGIPRSRSRVPINLFVRKTSEDRAAKLMAFVKDQLKAEAFISGDYVVATPPGGKVSDMSLTGTAVSSREAIGHAFQSVADYPVQLLIVPPDHVWRTVAELSPELPIQLGGGPSSVLTEGLQWAALGVDPVRLRTEVVVQSTTAAAARNFAAHLPLMLRSAYDAAPHLHERLPGELALALIERLEPQVEGNRVLLLVEGLAQTTENLTLLSGIAQTIAQKTWRGSNQQRLKQILLGIHNYHDTHAVLPPADKYRDANGKQLLSWRVHILPYVGEAELYLEFHLDEPWDSPNNKALIPRMPDVFSSGSLDLASLGKTKPGHTAFLAPVGDNTIFGGAKSTKFHQIRDGSSNTIAVVEVTPERAVPWTAPQDFHFDPQNPLAGVSTSVDGRWLSAFADGSVRHLPGRIGSEIMLHLFQMDDGHAIDRHQLQ